jgi:hypothetical protein
VARAPDDASAAAWVERVLGRLPAPWSRTCLRRAAVLYYLLRSAGSEVELCIGVRRNLAGTLRAHAWLVRNGAVYLESDKGVDHAEGYSMIARFPSTTAHSA